MTTPTVDIERLRDDFRTVAADRKACGYWTEADEQEAGQMIKADLGGSDESLKACWASWLAHEAEKIRRERSMAISTDESMAEATSPQQRNRLATTGR